MADFSREQATEWWKGLDAKRRTRWAPILKAMTEAEREDFHEQRRKQAAQFQSMEGTMQRAQEEAKAEAITHWLWIRRLGERAKDLEPVTASECLP